MGRHIAKTMGTRPFEIEVSVDETSEPTSVLEHLFIGLELRRPGRSPCDQRGPTIHRRL